MSCWRTYQCDALKKADKEQVIQALTNLEVSVDQKVKVVHGTYERRQAEVDGILHYHNRSTDVGIIFNGRDNNVEIVGDFWGSGLDSTTFMDNLAQQYLKITAENQLRMAGYVIENVSTNASGEIEIEAVAYA